jgi:hypothetical protein
MATFIKAGFWDKLCQPCKGYKGWLNLDELIQSFIPKPKYKVFTALLTQSGGDDPQSLAGSGSLVVGVTYIIDDDGGSGWDFTNVGAPNNNIGTFFVATGTTPNSWGFNGYLVYNTGAPVVTVLENTIGNIWFTYNDVGIYYVNSDNAFIIGKTWNTKCLDFGVNGGTLRALLSNDEDLNTMTVYTESDYDIVANGILNNTPIEIRVYN